MRTSAPTQGYLVSRRGGYQPPAVDPAVIVRADHICPYEGLRWCARRGRCPQRPASTAAPPINAQKMHPAIAAQSRRASKQGKQKAPDTHRRAAAGGERSTTTSLHPRRSRFHQAFLPNGSPGSGPAGPANFGYFPSRESSPPAGGTPPSSPAAAGEIPRPHPQAKNSENPPVHPPKQRTDRG